MSRLAHQESAAQRHIDNLSPPEPCWDSVDADEQAISDLSALPAFVAEAMGDCCDELTLAFAAGKDMEPILAAACRAKAELELEDSQQLLGDRRIEARERVLRTWKAYQFKHGPHPATALCAEYDAQVAA